MTLPHDTVSSRTTKLTQEMDVHITKSHVLWLQCKIQIINYPLLRDENNVNHIWRLTCMLQLFKNHESWYFPSSQCQPVKKKHKRNIYMNHKYTRHNLKKTTVKILNLHKKGGNILPLISLKLYNLHAWNDDVKILFDSKKNKTKLLKVMLLLTKYAKNNNSAVHHRNSKVYR